MNGSLWELQLDFCVHDGTSQPNELPSEPGDYCYIKTVGGCGEGLWYYHKRKKKSDTQACFNYPKYWTVNLPYSNTSNRYGRNGKQCTRLIWKVVATVFYFKNEARNLMKVYIFRSVNIPSTNQVRDYLNTPHAVCAGHRQVRSVLWQCPKIYCKTGVILDEKFCSFKQKAFFLARLNKVHGELLYYPRRWR